MRRAFAQSGQEMRKSPAQAGACARGAAFRAVGLRSKKGLALRLS
jgi:hypothetical protein